MPWGAAAAVAGAVITSQAMKGSASTSADAQRQAAQTSADAQVRAAEIAAEQAKFRPVGISTRFGTSTFTKDAEGNIKEAGYTLSPELKAIQDYAMQQAQAGQADTTGLLGLGRGYLATSPEAAAQDYMAKQRALYAPGNEQALAAIRNQQLQTGRAGLATGGTVSGMAATNPEMAAYYNALADRERQLAANADLAAQQRITFGTGLLSSAYSPIATPLGLAGTTEAMGQEPFTLGINLGGRQTQANQTAAQLYQSGITSAANTLAGGQAAAARTTQLANQYSPLGAGLTGLGQQIGTPAAGQLGSWFNNMLTNYNFGSSGMSSGMSGGMAPGVNAPQAATWETAFGGTGGMGD
jgi:hypothetical protein